MHQPTLNQVRLTHLGGPTVLIEIGPLRLLTDPTFESAGYQYERGSSVIRKTASPALNAAQVGPVDVVLLSHDQHLDNLDPAGRATLPQAKQVLTTAAGAERLGGNARGVNTWQTITLVSRNGLNIRVTATPARHGPEDVWPVMGDVNGWILEWEGQRRGALYVSGDTVLFEGLEEVARRYPVGVALLHLGAAQSPVTGPAVLTLSAAEGVRFAAMLGQATIVPIHYEGWTHLTEGRSEIEQAFTAAGLEHQLRFLPPGQPVSLEV